MNGSAIRWLCESAMHSDVRVENLLDAGCFLCGAKRRVSSKLTPANELTLRNAVDSLGALDQLPEVID